MLPSRSFQTNLQPFQPESWKKLVSAALTGCVASGIIWWAARSASGWESLAEPPLLAAHAISVGLFVWGVMDLWAAKQQRDKLTESDGVTRFVGSHESVSVWKQTIEECQNSHEDFSRTELPAIYDQVGNLWIDTLAQRYSICLMFASAPVVLGFLQGANALSLSSQGAYLAGFGEVFFPLIWTTAEGLLCGALIWWGCRAYWEKTVTQWKILASTPIWDDHEREWQQVQADDSIGTAHSKQSSDNCTAERRKSETDTNAIANGAAAQEMQASNSTDLSPSGDASATSIWGSNAGGIQGPVRKRPEDFDREGE